MNDEVVVKREWRSVVLDKSLVIGESTYLRDWCFDVDTTEYPYNSPVTIITYDGEGHTLEEKQVQKGVQLRVCIQGWILELNGTGLVKYAFPWVLLREKVES